MIGAVVIFMILVAGVTGFMVGWVERGRHEQDKR